MDTSSPAMSTATTSPMAMRQVSRPSVQHDIAANLLEAAAQASAAQESSAESGDDGVAGSPDSGQKAEKRKKRSRACQACRNMKIRCNPVEGQDACLACSKVNRECIMPGPARKRQKTVHKVAELEKKINALTQSLLAKTQANPTPQQSPGVTDASRSTKDQGTDSPDKRSNFLPFPKLDKPVIPVSRFAASDSNYEDVIDRGLLSFATADRMFDRFVSELNPLCPLVAFVPGTTFESIRRTRPMLSLAILSAACISLIPEIHVDLCEEIARQLAHRVYYLFEKSVDLVEALLVHTTWVGKHKVAKEVGFNHYIHSAIVMAHDLGMSKRLKIPLTKNPVEEAELRRTWLACIWAGLCVSTTLRHPPMVRNSPYVQDCLDFFAKSPAALPSDRTLCALVKVVLIMGDVAICFAMDDPGHTICIEDASTQYAMTVFEKRLEVWRKENVKNLPHGLLDLIHATASLYINEQALHTNHDVDNFRPPSGRPGAIEGPPIPIPFTPAHLEALNRCVLAMKKAIDSFLSIFPSRLQQLPCLSLVWTAYSVVAMIRLDGALRASNSEYADIYLPELNVEHYLDEIVEHTSTATAQAHTCAPASMFVGAFQKLRVWHQYRLAGGKLPPELADMNDPKGGMLTVQSKLDRFMEEKERSERAAAGAGDRGDASTRSEWQQHQGMTANATQRMQNGQDFDVQGGSWLTNANFPIDASMFENQDWNFTLEEWNNFDASMGQPAGGTWLGYLL